MEANDGEREMKMERINNFGKSKYVVVVVEHGFSLYNKMSARTRQQHDVMYRRDVLLLK